MKCGQEGKLREVNLTYRLKARGQGGKHKHTTAGAGCGCSWPSSFRTVGATVMRRRLMATGADKWAFLST